MIYAILILAGFLWYPSHQWLHFDEHCFIWCPLGLWGGSDPQFYNYGHLEFYVLSVLYKVKLWFSGEEPFRFMVRHFFIDGTDLVEIARMVSWACGLATMGIVYRIGAMLRGHRAGVCAAVAMLLIPACGRLFPYAMTDVPAMMFGAAALWASIFMLQNRMERKSYFPLWLPGVFVGLAASCKYPAALFMVPVWMALWIKTRPVRLEAQSNKIPLFARIVGPLILFSLPALAAALAFALTSPYFLLNWPAAWAAISQMAAEHTSGAHEYPFASLAYIPFGVGFFAIALAGWALWGNRDEHRDEKMVLLSSVVAGGAFCLVSSSSFLRYWLMIVPGLAALAGVGLHHFIVREQRRVWDDWLLVMLGAIPAWLVIQNAVLLRQPDTREVVRQQVEQSAGRRYVLVPGSVSEPGVLSPSFLASRQVRFYNYFGGEELEAAYLLLSKEEDLPPLALMWSVETLEGMVRAGAGKPDSGSVVLVEGRGYLADRHAEGGEQVPEQLLGRTKSVIPVYNPAAHGTHDDADWLFMPLAPVLNPIGEGRMGLTYQLRTLAIPYDRPVPTTAQWFELFWKHMQAQKLITEGAVDWPAVVRAYQEILTPYNPDEIFSVNTTSVMFMTLAAGLEQTGHHDMAGGILQELRSRMRGVE